MKMIFALVSLIAGLGLIPAKAHEDDARVLVVDNTINVQAEIFVYGEAATQQRADEIRQTILKCWARRADGSPWTYDDPISGRRYTVSFDVIVSLYGGTEHAQPKIIPGNWDPLNRKNYIYLPNTPMRSYVHMGDAGKWFPSSHQTYAHEFGHLIGLNDRYHDVNVRVDVVGGQSYNYVQSEANPGWSTNIMANSDGAVEQRNIDTIASRILRRKKFHDQTSWSAPKAGEAFHDEINIPMPKG